MLCDRCELLVGYSLTSHLAAT